MSAAKYDCAAPDPQPRSPQFTVPPNSCDCHAHVIGPAETHHFVADRSYTPPDALLGDYLKVLSVLGLQRAVLVQPSMHGADNTVMMKAVAESQEVDMRAIVVVAPDISDKELSRLNRSGARGVRINLIYGGGGVGFDAAEELAARIRAFGWHLQILADVSQVGAELMRLSSLPVPVVLDHMGHLSSTNSVRDKGFSALMELVRRGNTWVKLSGAYRLTVEEFPYADVRPFVDALVGIGAERLLWGTDWPHTMCRVNMPNDGDLLNLLHEWVTDRQLLAKILVANPASLYGFGLPKK